MTGGLSFRDEMLAAVPHLRAFAFSLSRNVDAADDLVQETLVRAWQHQDRFEPGTSMKSWLFTILRNEFYSRLRKANREVDDPDGSFARQLRIPPEQPSRLDYEDMRRALAKLPHDHREALLLVAAEGMSYDEAANICGAPIGTIKSRVYRARERLTELLAVETGEDLGPDRMTQAALQHAL